MNYQKIGQIMAKLDALTKLKNHVIEDIMILTSEISEGVDYREDDDYTFPEEIDAEQAQLVGEYMGDDGAPRESSLPAPGRKHH
jgi:hypothetical protein